MVLAGCLHSLRVRAVDGPRSTPTAEWVAHAGSQLGATRIAAANTQFADATMRAAVAPGGNPVYQWLRRGVAKCIRTSGRWPSLEERATGPKLNVRLTDARHLADRCM